jgi:hypothetical protein
MGTAVPPKVFLSHASEDKDRFVLGFAARLREKGIDAWLDRWEMLPGDSLVDKIFEEGLKEAAAVIVVISAHSIQKKWVREELNAAFIKRVSNGSKLIPVVIDDCEVPEALKSTVWVRVADTRAYDAALDRIVASIFGMSERPPIGSPPAYVDAFSGVIGRLNRIDSLVLKLSCDAVVRTGDKLVNPGEVFSRDGIPTVPEQELIDSLEVLNHGGYIKLHRLLNAGPSPFQLTTFGFDAYARACIADYQGKITRVAATIVNKGLESNDAIQADTGEPKFIVNHILDVLEGRGQIKQAKTLGGQSHIHYVSPLLRRALEQY